MQFIEIDMKQWVRGEHYQHYKENVQCAFSLTVMIDITDLLIKLKKMNLKAYPVQIYMLTTVVNQFKEFRMTTSEKHQLGYWDILDSMYTVLNMETETFSAVWTKYNRCFQRFYDACLEDINQYSTGVLFPQKNLPPNVFNISSLPWLDFTSFHLNVFSGENYLLPIFTIGRYRKENEKTFMPLAIQCHHAVCDGFHVGKFVESLRQMAASSEEWLLYQDVNFSN